MNVRTRAWRVLAKGGHVVGYRALEPHSVRDDPIVRAVTLAPGEEAIGVYENPSAVDVPALLITTQALRVMASLGEHVVLYDRIKSVAGPTTKDAARPTITVALDDGAAVEFPVLGRRGHALDVFELLRFLQRVVEDTRRG